MRWNILSLDESNSLSCTVCGRVVPDASVSCGDILYIPRFSDGDDWQASEIEKRWGVDAYADFAICNQCCGGYCGAIPWRDADAWLAGQMKEGDNGVA